MSDYYRISHENIKACNEIITADITSYICRFYYPNFTGKSANAAKDHMREVYAGSNSMDFEVLVYLTSKDALS